MRQADLLDDRSGPFQGGDCVADPALDVRLHPGDEVLARQPEPLATQPCRRLVVACRESDQLVRHGHRRRGRIALVAPGDRVEERSRVARVTGERPDLVERRGEGDDPVARHSAVRRLEPDDPGQCRRLADRAAGVCPDRQRRVEGRDRDRRAAAAATRHCVEVPRVRDGAVGAVLVRRAHRELVHVRLAENDSADVAKPLGDVGVIR